MKKINNIISDIKKSQEECIEMLSKILGRNIRENEFTTETGKGVH